WAMRGPATTVLSELAGPADMLVVGPSGHHAVVGAILGSVTTYLITHARCPVVVVRGDEDKA
ncbi:MAG TPA: universal stress protein, partial [Actinomycetes bacterium]